MKDSQRDARPQNLIPKYIKANNERFSTDTITLDVAP